MDEQKLQDMINEDDRFGVASYFVDKFFIDFIDGMNEQSVDYAFTSIGLGRTYIENTCIKINEKVNPFDAEQLGHNASKKIIYKSILINCWEQRMPDNLDELRNIWDGLIR
jgi:hypothetical protein